METDGKDGSNKREASETADFWTRLGMEGVLVHDVPQVGQENLRYRDANGQRGTLPGMIRSVSATDPEGTQFRIALYEPSAVCITATLTDRSKRLRRVTASSHPPDIAAVDQNRAGADYVSGT